MRYLTLGEVIDGRVTRPTRSGRSRVRHRPTTDEFRGIGPRLDAEIDDSERAILAVASGEMDRRSLAFWIQAHIVPLDGGARKA